VKKKMCCLLGDCVFNIAVSLESVNVARIASRLGGVYKDNIRFRLRGVYVKSTYYVHSERRLCNIKCRLVDVYVEGTIWRLGGIYIVNITDRSKAYRNRILNQA